MRMTGKLEKRVEDLLLEIHHILWAIDNLEEVESAIAEEKPDDIASINQRNISAVRAASKKERGKVAFDIGDWCQDFSETAHKIRVEKKWYPPPRKSRK